MTLTLLGATFRPVLIAHRNRMSDREIVTIIDAEVEDDQPAEVQAMTTHRTSVAHHVLTPYRWVTWSTLLDGGYCSPRLQVFVPPELVRV